MRKKHIYSYFRGIGCFAVILLVCVIVVFVLRIDRDLDFLATYLKGTPTNVP